MPLLRNLAEKPTWCRTPTIKEKPTGVDRKGGDKGKGVIEGAAVITTGLVAKGHGAWIDETFGLQAAAALLAAKRGLASRFTHPGPSDDGLGKLVGRGKPAKDASKPEDLIDGRVVRADIHFSKSAKKTPNGDLAGYLMDIADEDDDCFGLSIVFMNDRPAEEAFRREHLDENGFFVSPDPENSANRLHWRLLKLKAVDFVDAPAANDGLFSELHVPDGPEIEAAWSYLTGLSDDASLLEPMGLTSFIHPDRLRKSFTGFMAGRHLTITEQLQAPEGEDMAEKTPKKEAETGHEEALQKLNAERAELKKERLAARTERAEAQAEREVGGLGARMGLGPKQRLRSLLTVLHSAEGLPAIEESSSESNLEVSLGAYLVTTLQMLPEMSLMGGELGDEDDDDAQSPRDPRSKGERKTHQSAGIDDKRVQALNEKFGVLS